MQLDVYKKPRVITRRLTMVMAGIVASPIHIPIHSAWYTVDSRYSINNYQKSEFIMIITVSCQCCVAYYYDMFTEAFYITFRFFKLFKISASTTQYNMKSVFQFYYSSVISVNNSKQPHAQLGLNHVVMGQE